MAQAVTAGPGLFAHSGSPIGKIIDEFDWSATSLGPIGAWAPVVRNTVELILRSPVPIVTMWGADGVMIYNEGYARSLLPETGRWRTGPMPWCCASLTTCRA